MKQLKNRNQFKIKYMDNLKEPVPTASEEKSSAKTKRLLRAQKKFVMKRLKEELSQPPFHTIHVDKDPKGIKDVLNFRFEENNFLYLMWINFFQTRGEVNASFSGCVLQKTGNRKWTEVDSEKLISSSKTLKKFTKKFEGIWDEVDNRKFIVNN